MKPDRIAKPLIGAALAVALSAATAQERPDPAVLLAAQREAMATFAFMDGVWRGPASTVLPSGELHAITQTERIGSLLGGTVKVIEGRGYERDGRTTFNALGIISYRIVPGKDPVRFFEMKLRRVGDSDWPGAGAVSPQ